MKTLPLLLALACMPAMAETVEADEPASCQLQGEIAEGLMTARQVGLPMYKLMEMKSMANLKPAIIQAYKAKIEKSEARKQATIIKFRDGALMYCYEGKAK